MKCKHCGDEFLETHENFIRVSFPNAPKDLPKEFNLEREWLFCNGRCFTAFSLDNITGVIIPVIYPELNPWIPVVQQLHDQLLKGEKDVTN